MPLAIRWGADVLPGGEEPSSGRRLDEFVSLVDLAPTFLEAAGVEVPEAMTGRSLMPLLFRMDGRSADNQSAHDRMHVVFGRERHTAGRPGSVGYPSRGIRTERWAFLRNHEPTRWPAGDPPLYADCDPHANRSTGLTKGMILAFENTDEGRRFYDWSFARRPAEELYDMANDPDQLVNLARGPSPRRAEGGTDRAARRRPGRHGGSACFGRRSRLRCVSPTSAAGVWKESVAHANGIKIGEVTDTSALLWTRLTRHAEALTRVRDWDPVRPHWEVPGATGEVRFAYGRRGDPDSVQYTEWSAVGASNDSCWQVAIAGLAPATEYVIEAQGRLQGNEQAASSFPGSFTTAPAPGAEPPIRFVVSSCQDFPRRDDPDNGHQIYRSMLSLDPAFFVQTGDTVYYDKPAPFAKDIATARYKWNRMYALPNLRAFHAVVPSYWMHDDHDVLRNDCWRGQTYGEFTWEQGLQVWGRAGPRRAKCPFAPSVGVGTSRSGFRRDASSARRTTRPTARTSRSSARSNGAGSGSRWMSPTRHSSSTSRRRQSWARTGPTRTTTTRTPGSSSRALD